MDINDICTAIAALASEARRKIAEATTTRREGDQASIDALGAEHHDDVTALHGALSDFAAANPAAHPLPPMPAAVPITAGQPAGPATVEPTTLTGHGDPAAPTTAEDASIPPRETPGEAAAYQDEAHVANPPVPDGLAEPQPDPA